MKGKSLYFLVGIAVFACLAGAVLVGSTDKKKDAETRQLIEELSSLTDAVVSVISTNDANEEAKLTRAQELLNQKRDGLKERFRLLKEGGDVLVYEDTEQALSDSLYANSEKLKVVLKNAYDDLRVTVHKSQELKGADPETVAGGKVIAAYTSELERKKKIAERIATIVNTYNSIFT